MSSWKSLQELLKSRAEIDNSGQLFIYTSGNTVTPKVVSYKELYNQAKAFSAVVRSLANFEKDSPVLLHLDNHWDTILWFWAVLLADGLPVLSSPFSNVDEHRRQHIQGLASLLESPICLIQSKSSPLFGNDHGMHLFDIGELALSVETRNSHDGDDPKPKPGDLAALMLTSGSTGNAKAVRLTHKQILASVAGKSAHRKLPLDRPMLNWIGMDHVAGLIEIHMHALFLGVDQVHVNAVDVVSSPRIFLDLLSHHRVSRSFAPNFFLAKLVSTVQTPTTNGNTMTDGTTHGLSSSSTEQDWDLSNLLWLVSGGEANDVKTVDAVATLLQQYGAPRNVVSAGFGMTETCAGCIYHLDNPNYDMANGNAVCSLGTPVPGAEMRVAVSINKSPDEVIVLAQSDEQGELQVRGPMVFEGYYRNDKATREAFTSDGWFRTGDQAVIDPHGNLNLIGRTTDVININGVKFVTADIQMALEQALAGRVSRLVVFPSRAAHTEQITVAYVPLSSSDQGDKSEEDIRAQIDQVAVEVCMFSSASRPLVFALRAESVPLLPTSALGKISRAKMRILFEGGAFEQDVRLHAEAVSAVKTRSEERRPASEQEELLINDFAETLGSSPDDFDIDTSVFDLGFTSMHLIRLKHRIDTRLGVAVPIITVIKNPTARSLAAALFPDKTSSSSGRQNGHAQHGGDDGNSSYDPVVTFRTKGAKTPLWLVHPGVGEVLVFVGLAHHMSDDDRPLYALRARGFEPGQTVFASIEEAVDTYVAVIRARQPTGPYALAGYSYGTMLAFEVAKRLELADGVGVVKFLGSFNLPPHIKHRMRQLNWNMCLLNLAYFLDLTTEDYAESLDRQSDYCNKTREEAMEHILQVADVDRLRELGHGPESLARWADVAYGLQSMAVDYDPEGVVDSMDVFHAIPLKAVSRSREEWLRDHVGKWSQFTRTTPRFHEVDGAHYTMIGPDHVVSFSKKLKAALVDRGI
ncbi:hypothetical protein B0H66DRAFT_520643 [Apodospora peruviana]|uniref:Carrier domain-containing protein n=1 Tax=Apodospora peruviana TaxID=516989 RepID=A0AAE0M0N1_9PEZI|nr:hypothetical protein B0H66DRAFT_520643 [Apodospora peruviana]